MSATTRVRPMTIDQARTQDLEIRGIRNAVVRSDGLRRAVIECDLDDLDHLCREVQSLMCDACERYVAEYCEDCATGPEDIF